MLDTLDLFQQMSPEFCVHLTFSSIASRLADPDDPDGRYDLMLAMMMGVEISQ